MARSDPGKIGPTPGKAVTPGKARENPQLSRSTGVHVIAASTKDQFAAEVKELGHGVFTYTLLEGLKGKASGGTETITVRKLMGYVEERLPDITKRYKKEAQYPMVDSRGMDFPLVITK